ncbi:MAG: efflux RND transporter permease subunit, partial [Candidatus Latescibacterota bacterium]
MTSVGLAGRLAGFFINSKLTPLLVVASLLLGGFALLQTPREEEPQIIVPMVDVFVNAPGLSAKEVEQRVTYPMEKLLWEIPGVEYVYSTSSNGRSMAIVRFLVGEDEEDSILKTYNQLYANFDLIPAGVSKPLVKPRSIDDVPIVALTFTSEVYDGFALRRIAAEVERGIKQIADVSQTQLIGGLRRLLRIELSVDRLAAYGILPDAVVAALEGANYQLPAGRINRLNGEVLVETGLFLRDADEVAAVVVSVHEGRPVYLGDVADIIDGPEEPSSYVRFGRGSGETQPAVTLSIAKRKGTNATVLAEQILQKVERLSGVVVPGDVSVVTTRNYGETAREKSDELLFHMGLATVSVILLIWLALGFRESGVVGIAIPVTLGLTLFTFYL